MSVSVVQDVCGVTVEVARRALEAANNSTETAIELLLADVAFNDLAPQPTSEVSNAPISVPENTDVDPALIDSLAVLFPDFEQFFLEFQLRNFGCSIDPTIDYLLLFREKDESSRQAEIEQARVTMAECNTTNDIQKAKPACNENKKSDDTMKNVPKKSSTIDQLMNEEGLFIVESTLQDLEIKRGFIESLLKKTEFSEEEICRLKYTGTDVGYPEDLMKDINQKVLFIANAILNIVNGQIREVTSVLEKITVAINDRKFLEELSRRQKEEENKQAKANEQRILNEVSEKEKREKQAIEKELKELLALIRKLNRNVSQSDKTNSVRLISLFPCLTEADAVSLIKKYDYVFNSCIQELELLQKNEISHVFLPYTKDFLDLIQYRQNNKKTNFLSSQSTKGVVDVQKKINAAGQKRFCFDAMLDLEYHFKSDFFVYYHSFSFALLLYEVNTVLAQEVFGAPKHFAPLPRLFFRAFDSMIETQMLKDEVKKKNSDHGVEFRDTTLSVSNSIFAFGSEAPPINVFNSGYSCIDISFRGILKSNLIECGMKPEKAEEATKELVNLAKMYKIDYNAYGETRSGNVQTATGGMLQIFVKKEDADYISYISHAYGRTEGLETKPSKHFEKEPVDGQARLFVHPRYFVLDRRALIFYYHTNSELSFGETRQTLLNDIRIILSELYCTPDVRERTRRRIMGISMDDEPVDVTVLQKLKQLN